MLNGAWNLISSLSFNAQATLLAAGSDGNFSKMKHQNNIKNECYDGLIANLYKINVEVVLGFAFLITKKLNSAFDHKKNGTN